MSKDKAAPWLVCMALALLLGACASGPSGSAGNPAPLPSPLEQARVVQRAFMIEDLFNQGVERGARDKLGNHPDAARIVACIKEGYAVRVGDVFAQALADDMPPEALAEGYRLTLRVPVERIRPYVLANASRLRDQALREGRRPDEYNLVGAAYEIPLPSADVDAVNALVNWHWTNRERLGAERVAAELADVSLRVGRHCAAGPE